MQSNEMRAEQLFRSGEKKFDGGAYVEACADFAESLRLGPKLGTLLNLALCHETIGRPATAWSEFHHAAAWAAQNGQKDRREFAARHAQALETKLPRVVLHLPSDRAIDSVDVDGEPLPDSRWYLPVYLDPGEHSVTVRAPGKKATTVRFRVVLSPTDQVVTVPSLVDDEAVAAPQMPDEDTGRGARTVGFVLLGAAGATITTGIVLGALGASRTSGCAEAGCSADDRSAASTLSTVGVIAGVSGLVMAGAGGLLVWTNRPGQGVVRASVAPRPEGGAMLGLGGVF